VDNRDEVKAFLSSRRAKITPEQAGLSSYNRNRGVPGLRRSEVADLAGVSHEQADRSGSYYSARRRGPAVGRWCGSRDVAGVDAGVAEGGAAVPPAR
jgi:hypothetical protein